MSQSINQSNHQYTDLVVNLGGGFLVGLFSGFEGADAHGGQLRLEDRNASSGGRQQLEGGLQRRTQSRLSLHRLTEHLRQTRKQILHQLQRQDRRGQSVQSRGWQTTHQRRAARSLTSLHSFRLTKRLSGVGKNTSEGRKAESQLTSDISLHVLRTDGRMRFTVDVWHDEHLRLWQPFLEVVEMDGAVERDEADFHPSVSGKPSAQRHTKHTDERTETQGTAASSVTLTYESRLSRRHWHTTSRYPVSTALWDTSRT